MTFLSHALMAGMSLLSAGLSASKINHCLLNSCCDTFEKGLLFSLVKPIFASSVSFSEMPLPSSLKFPILDLLLWGSQSADPMSSLIPEGHDDSDSSAFELSSRPFFRAQHESERELDTPCWFILESDNLLELNDDSDSSVFDSSSSLGFPAKECEDGSVAETSCCTGRFPCGCCVPAVAWD
eukprot:CAMPEP_0178750970 /NCGR_PEP_ID=MMETSP0744-20121128/10283_1 /TAXON_ID=913974 /ORGANISM="Nitzschia punctata, Strain CCMP561" /LENGTH=181 /DNA_ID=CAMNT_0020404597 /DNA_START=223 /DNA_END=768 /DNA_ORIENTATION=-